ncbi:MAG: DUF192 domain-containing protein [Planctomycetes bacterium]|nr:DUF192 domain-containing protein [Planctomycetota bacterium]
MKRRNPFRVFALVALCGGFAGCVGTPVSTNSTSQPASSTLRNFPLGTLQQSTVTIAPETPAGGQPPPARGTFRTWLARTTDQHSEGLMYVPAEEIADDQGMLFVFSDERLRGFWMKNTITELDIAFARMDGTIVAIHTMPPLTLQTFSSIEPAMFALEVKGGRLAALGVAEGDRMIIPDEVFKTAP